MSTPKIQEDCINIPITATVLKEDGTAWDLTGATIYFIFSKPDGTKITRDGFVRDGDTGKVGYATVSGDLDTVGTWKWQIKAVLVDGTVLFTEITKIKVSENIN